jgi:hypothetical protein
LKKYIPFLSKIKKLKKIILLILLPFITFGVYAQTKSRSKSKISSQKTIKLTEETINSDALDSLLAREVRKARETEESQNEDYKYVVSDEEVISKDSKMMTIYKNDSVIQKDIVNY